MYTYNPFKDDTLNVKSTVMHTEKPSRLRTRINFKLHFGEHFKCAEMSVWKTCKNPSSHLATVETGYFVHSNVINSHSGYLD